MNYVKIFKNLPISEAEDTLNAYMAEVGAKGHRIMHTFCRVRDEDMLVLFTINDVSSRGKS